MRILLHEQVVTDTDAPPDAGGELLSAFNVATFKAEEDDTAFWNRLISADERPRENSKAAPENLGIRTARLRNMDDVSILGLLCCSNISVK